MSMEDLDGVKEAVKGASPPIEHALAPLHRYTMAEAQEATWKAVQDIFPPIHHWVIGDYGDNHYAIVMLLSTGKWQRDCLHSTHAPINWHAIPTNGNNHT